MTTMASQITSLMVVYSIAYSDADQRNHQSPASLAFLRGFTGTGEFPAQTSSNAENVSIWWRHHGSIIKQTLAKFESKSKSIWYQLYCSRIDVPKHKSLNIMHIWIHYISGIVFFIYGTTCCAWYQICMMPCHAVHLIVKSCEIKKSRSLIIS